MVGIYVHFVVCRVSVCLVVVVNVFILWLWCRCLFGGCSAGADSVVGV